MSRWRPASIERAMLDVVGERHRPEHEWFWTELAILGELWGIGRHSYVQAWVRGELTTSDLRVHATEYDEILVAQATVVDRAARRASGLVAELLEREAAAAEAELEEWRAFARAVGWRGAAAWFYGEEPCPETAAASRTIIGSIPRRLSEDLLTLLILAGVHANVATRQLDAVRRRYQLHGAACAWFERHAAIGAERTARLRAALQGLLDRDDPLALVRHAETLQCQLHQLLDCLEDTRA